MTAPFVIARFKLLPETIEYVHSLQPKFGFGPVGEFVYYRTYSRIKPNGQQEHWADTVIRCTEGIMSVRKDHCLKHHLHWQDDEWQEYAKQFAVALFEMHFTLPGRGLFCCGSELMYERGSAALYNCAAVDLSDFIEGCSFCFSALMHGSGVGVSTEWDGEITEPAAHSFQYTKSFIPSEKDEMYRASSCTLDPRPPMDVAEKSYCIMQLDNTYIYQIPDSREGWVEAMERLLAPYFPHSSIKFKEVGYPFFVFDLIRPKGTPIRGFGGTASGPEPLRLMLKSIEVYLQAYLRARKGEELPAFLDVITKLWEDYPLESDYKERMEEAYQKYHCKIDKTWLAAMIINKLGICTVSGGVRRSSEILFGAPDDDTFLNLKNYQMHPEREPVGWMSNNTCRLRKTEDFAHLPKIAKLIMSNGEPGILNLLNVGRYGRVAHRHDTTDTYTRELEPDKATLCNPCGEIPLESGEVCNLCEVYPTRCTKDKRDRTVNGGDTDAGLFDKNVFISALRFATFYSSTVTLLPTHWAKTNAIIARNRRIGVSLSGVADLHDRIGFTALTALQRESYKVIRAENKRLADLAGIPESIRVTTIKPSGTVSLLAGVSPGLHFPTFRYAIRRVRVEEHLPIAQMLKRAGVPCELDHYSRGTLCFSFPVDNGHTRPAADVSMWEQFGLLAALQREYSDNMVSCTIYFNPQTEGKQLELALAQFAPVIKSCSMLPHTDEGAYVQMPYEGITEERYLQLSKKIVPINWKAFTGSDGVLPRFCDGEKCT